MSSPGPLRHLIAALLAMAGLCATAASVLAANHAVLVGVSDYEFDGIGDLKGPPNDVRMMRDVLQEKGVPAENITAIADGIEGAQRPTRAVIMQALNDLVDRLDPAEEDFVTIYLSGHGTRQPDYDNDEGDGLDELFLPIDVAPWDGAEGTEERVVNAIVDDEIGEVVARLRAKNALVWVIMDSCHSGSGTRLASTEVRARRVRSSDLGLTTDATVTIEEQNDFAATPAEASDKGGFVAFFAAQAFQQAVEVAMPAEENDSGAKQWYGLFTSHLWKRLKSDRTLSFAQLFEAVKFDMERYQANSGGAQWPALEGEHDVLERFPLESGTSAGRSWRLSDSSTLNAGRLHGLRDGAVLAVYRDPAARDEDEIGHIQIYKAAALTSKVKLIDYPCSDTDQGLYCRRSPSPSLPEANFARLMEPVVDVVLRLSTPKVLTEDGGSGEPGPEYANLLAALDTVKAMSPEELKLTVAFDEDPFHVSVGLKDGRMWFADSDGFRPNGLQGVPSAIAWPAEDAALADPRSLADLLRRLGMIHNLAAVTAELSEGTPGRLAEPMPLDINVTVTPADRAALANPVSDDLFEECQSVRRGAEVDIGEMNGNLTQCDTVNITLTKSGRSELDVTVLYKDARGAIQTVFPKIPGQNRIESNRPLRLPFFEFLCAKCPGDIDGRFLWSFGPETLFVVAAVADGSTTLDLSHLAQEAISEVTTRSTGTDRGLTGSLTRLVLGGQRRRGGLGGARERRIWMKSVSWTVWPREAMVQHLAQQ